MSAEYRSYVLTYKQPNRLPNNRVEWEKKKHDINATGYSLAGVDEDAKDRADGFIKAGIITVNDRRYSRQPLCLDEVREVYRWL